MKNILLLVFLSLFQSPFAYVQVYEDDVDLLGKAHAPIVGILENKIAKSVPHEIGNKIAYAVIMGLSGPNWAKPYTTVGKKKLDLLDEYRKIGADKAQLRKKSYWATLGCQYLFQVEVNSWQIFEVSNKIFNAEGVHTGTKQTKKAFANVTARLTDVATSKILAFENINLHASAEAGGATKDAKANEEILKSIRSQATTQSKMVFPAVISASSEINGVHEQKKDKALSVLLNRVTPTIKSKKRQ